MSKWGVFFQPVERRRRGAGRGRGGAWSKPQAPPPKSCSGSGAPWPEKGGSPGAEEALGRPAGSHDCRGPKVPRAGTQRVSEQRGAGGWRGPQGSEGEIRAPGAADKPGLG